jgi:hypothetical protein
VVILFTILKAMVENDANIRIQLENGYNHWEFEGGMEQTFTFHPDWFAIDRKNNSLSSSLLRSFIDLSNFTWKPLSVILSSLL